MSSNFAAKTSWFALIIMGLSFLLIFHQSALLFVFLELF